MPGTEQDPTEPQPAVTVTNLESGNLASLVTIVCDHFFSHCEAFVAHFPFCPHLLRSSDPNKHVCLSVEPFDFFFSSKVFVPLFSGPSLL